MESGLPGRDQRVPFPEGDVADAPEAWAGLIAGLVDHGWAVAPGFFPADLVAGLAAEAEALDQAGALAAAGIGRDGAAEPTVRAAHIHWLDGDTAPRRRWLAAMEHLRLALNRALFLGLFEYEGHYAVYPPGAFYRRHVDSLAGARNRLVSAVAYLDTDWRWADGGQLRIWDRSGALAAEVAPEAGTLALFLSEEIPHEVRPTRRRRHAVPGWFRCNASIAGRVDPPR